MFHLEFRLFAGVAHIVASSVDDEAVPADFDLVARESGDASNDPASFVFRIRAANQVAKARLASRQKQHGVATTEGGGDRGAEPFVIGRNHPGLEEGGAKQGSNERQKARERDQLSESFSHEGFRGEGSWRSVIHSSRVPVASRRLR